MFKIATAKSMDEADYLKKKLVNVINTLTHINPLIKLRKSPGLTL